MIDALGIDSDIIELLRNAAMAEKPVTHLLALLLLTHDPEGESGFQLHKVMNYFDEAFGWHVGQMAALRAWSLFSANAWPDEVLDARYAPLLEAWRKNPSPYPIPEDDFDLSLHSGPLSEAEIKEIMKPLEMGWD